MDFTAFGFLDGLQIPLPVTLACACVCSYLIGQLPFAKPKATAPGTADADRVQRLLDRLADEIAAFREDLVAHEASLSAFQQELLTEDGDRPSPDQFSEDAKKALRAMQHLADEIPRAFHLIEHTTESAVDALKSEFQQLDESRTVESEKPAVESAADSRSDHRQEFSDCQQS